MSELDFAREGVPHRRGRSDRMYHSEADEFSRTVLLPQLFSLSPEERTIFDQQLVLFYGSESGSMTHHAAQQILRGLSTEELIHVSGTIQAFLEKVKH